MNIETFLSDDQAEPWQHDNYPILVKAPLMRVMNYFAISWDFLGNDPNNGEEYFNQNTKFRAFLKGQVHNYYFCLPGRNREDSKTDLGNIGYQSTIFIHTDKSPFFGPNTIPELKTQMKDEISTLYVELTERRGLHIGVPGKYQEKDVLFVSD